MVSFTTMNLEVLLLGVAAFALLAVALLLSRRLPVRVRGLLLVGCAALIALLAARTQLRSDLDRLWTSQADHPVQQIAEGYASSSACRACHPVQFESWHASYHRTMTQRPSEASIKGDFGVSLSLDGERITLSRDGGRFLADIPRPAWWNGPAPGGRIQRPVELVTGSHHYQVYWLSSGNSTFLAQLPFVWLTHEGRWAPRRSVFIAPPGAIGYEYGRWNSVCIRCHTTDGHPNLETGPPQVARSSVSEFGIACEACHGPGAAHAATMRNPLRRYAAYLGMPGESGMTNPRKLASERTNQICAQCHSVHVPTVAEYQHYLKSGFSYRPGDDLEKTRRAATESGPNLDLGYFWPDGMVRVTGREYHGLSASPCFKGGNFTCLSCHALHKPETDPRGLQEWRNALLRHFGDGNGQCLQCHEPLRKAEAQQAHTHHAAGSSGAECVNCHMPNTVYGLGKATRSHQITNPDVVADLRAGRPNACNLCHLDQTLEWTASTMAKWYGKRRPTLDNEQRRIAASLLDLYKGDAGQRALAVYSMGWAPARAVAGENWLLPHLVNAVDDRYEVIGLVAYRALRQFAAGKDLSPDFLALPPERRRAAVANAIRAPGPLTPAPSRLISSSGEIDEAAIRRLRAARNERPVLLKE
jgi:hypothetical protein